MTVAYDALLASHNPAFVVLAEVKPAERLNVWTAAGGGLTNTYYVSWVTQDATSIVPGGIYRRLDSVRQNDTALTSRASTALVNSNLGSYFYDTATSRIYISTTTGANPETFAFIGAWFTLFFSDVAVSFSDQPQYWPVITGSLPTFTSDMPDPLFGSTVSNAGALALMNGDGLFDRLALRYIWRNKKVTFKLGGVGLAYTDFETVGTMLINAATPSDEEFVLGLESMGSVLNRKIPSNGTFGDNNIIPASSLEEGVGARPYPWFWGTMTDCKLTFTDTQGSYEYYRYVDPLFSSGGGLVTALYAIHKTTRARTTLEPFVDYVTGSYYVQVVLALWPAETYEIWADMTRSPSTAGNVLEDLLLQMGEAAANIDSAAFDAVDANATHWHTLGIYLTESVTAADVVRKIEQSGMCRLRNDADGLWSARLFDPSTADWTLTDADFAAWEVDGPLTSSLTDVRAQYAETHATGAFLEASASSDAALFGNETSDSHTVPTYLRDREPAAAMANHMRFFKSHPGVRITFELRAPTMLAAQVGDMVAVTRSRGPVARTGAYEGQLLKLVSLTKTLGPVPTVTGVLWDMGGNADRIARCVGAAVTLHWSAATPTQKAFYGFCSDANGYIDSADPLTRNLKVGW